MPAREVPERPDWLVPGADVLCYNNGRNPSPVTTTVAKVATQSWIRKPDADNRRIAIAALQALDD